MVSTASIRAQPRFAGDLFERRATGNAVTDRLGGGFCRYDQLGDVAGFSSGVLFGIAFIARGDFGIGRFRPVA